MFNFENFTSRDMFARYESLDSEYNKSLEFIQKFKINQVITPR
jgi:hypothetical protein